MRDGELVRARGQFIAEGRLVVRRVIDDGRYRVRSVLVNDAARRALAASLEKLPAEVPVYICDTSAFVELTGYNIHRGCLALVERPPAMPLPDLLAARSSLVVLEAVTNADNVGGVFRNVAAFGAGGIVLSPTCCDPFYRKAIRTSMGAVFGVPFARASDWPADIARLRAAGFTIVALTPHPPAETLHAFGRRARPDRLALIVGTEGAGVSHAVESMADHRVRIPIEAAVDSLNVSVAAAIALWALVGDHC